MFTELRRSTKKLICGSDHGERKSRFHDENNVMIDFAAARDLPEAFVGWAKQKMSGRLPELPWWPFPVIRYLEKRIRGSWTVLEFGAGMSTLWLSKRSRQIISIEGNRRWVEWVASKLEFSEPKNVSLRLRDSSRYRDDGKYSKEFNSEFSSVSEFGNRKFDLIIVDGAARWLCVENSLPLLKRGGLLYLDNSDADKDWCHYTEPAQRKEAQKYLNFLEEKGKGKQLKMRGFSPCTLHVSEGTIFETPSS
jgi:predicted O-methyltransferase YrrM